jgi:hypothetical protein
MRGLRPLLLASVAFTLAAACSPAANASHDPKASFSGEWLMSFSESQPPTGTLRLKAVTDAVGEATRDSFPHGGWLPFHCTKETDWYTGTFVRGTDSGPLVACTQELTGGAYVVFKSSQFGVEGGIAWGASGNASFGVFPSEPNEQFSISFVKHFAGDGSAAEEVEPVPLCGRVPSALPSAAAVSCKLDRVVFLEGTKYFRLAAESRETAAGQYVYFRAAVNGHTLPAELLLLFPKEVGRAGIAVVRESDLVNDRRTEVDCGTPLFNAKRAQYYLLCKVEKTATSGVIVRVEVPQALRGKRLEVVLAAVRRQPGQSTPEVLDKITAGVDLEVSVSVPNPAPTAPPNDPIEGHWVEVRTSSALPRAFPDLDIMITRARDERTGALKQDLWVGRAGGVEFFLNRPDDQALVYDGTATGALSGTEPIQLQLLPPTGRPAFAFPFCPTLGVTEPILCGWWVKQPACLPCGTPIVAPGREPGRLVVLRRVPD